MAINWEDRRIIWSCSSLSFIEPIAELGLAPQVPYLACQAQTIDWSEKEMLECRKINERKAAGTDEREEFVFREMQINWRNGRERRVGWSWISRGWRVIDSRIYWWLETAIGGLWNIVYRIMKGTN